MTPTERVSLLDVNVLVALHDEAHLHHHAAMKLMLEQGRHGWSTCPLTENGCLRIICQPKYPHPFAFGEAVKMLSRSCAHSSHTAWPDDVSLLDQARFVHSHMHGHSQLNDMYLLALAVKHDGRLASFDARIPLSAVHGAKPHHSVLI